MIRFVEVQHSRIAANIASRIIQHLEMEINPGMVQTASETVDELDCARGPQVPVEPHQRKCLRCDISAIAEGHVVPRRSVQQLLGKAQGHGTTGLLENAWG